MNSIQWLSQLIAFDTTSRNSNLGLIAAVQSWFEHHHITSRLIRDPKEDKANLFATIPASTGQTTGGLILSGHTDVVPVDEQHWDSDPFIALKKDNKIHGRSIASNTIPADCEFTFEFRHLPMVSATTIHQTIDAFIKNILEPKMKQEYHDAHVIICRLAAVPSFEAQENCTISDIAKTLLKTNETRKVAYATEAGIFHKTNIPTIVCGPGSIQQAHRANEFVELTQLKKCDSFLRELVLALNQ